MKYRVFLEDCYPMPRTMNFKTKKEAMAYQKVYGGTIQRKIGGQWFDY